MPMKATGRASSWREIDEWDGGTGWIAHPDERMQRASHALVDGEDVWLVDPVDAAGLDERLADLGTVRGAVVLLDRHTRDSAAIARRHDVPVFVPEWMDDVAAEVDAPVEPIRRRLPESDYDLHRLVDNPFWKEGFLYDENSKTMVVAEAVGTGSFFRAGMERLGVHPALRLTPPRSLGRFAPERILVGHGHGVFDDAAGALAEALDSARWRAPRLYAETVREFVL
ncbi:hypothetical protein ACFQMA_05810 [Halosimplex aquaticum]|uniref:MBL fold metallo-hydrolase n=1 Tax=Halosimplex aquaticum TaxID=3026162 RepID=A0ABD5XW18_9EURY|nr:hypothetical protein [Halosimplex aquaticum]